MKSTEYLEKNEHTCFWLPRKLLAHVRRDAAKRKVPIRTIVIRALLTYLYENSE